MRQLFFLALLVVGGSALSFADSVSFIPASNSVIECEGQVMTDPPEKIHRITMTSFKQKTVYYTEEIQKGNEVIIVDYKGNTYQVIKL